MAEYQEVFEKLSHQVDGLPETFLIGCFIAGLQDEIRLDVKIKQPRTLIEAIGVARLIEERNSLFRGTKHFSQPPPISFMQPPISNSSTGILGPPPKANQTANANTPPPIQRLTNQEARARREKGLCYFCDEKFIPGQHCQRPQLFMIEDPPPFTPPDTG